MSRSVLAVDLGGTVVKAAVVDETGTVAGFVTAPSAEAGGPAAWLDAALDLARRAVDAAAGSGLPAPSALGLSVPGAVDASRAVLLDLVDRLATGDGLSLTDAFASLGLPVAADNDARAALAAEARWGAAAGVSDVVMLTLGTGLGGAVLVDGRPVGGDPVLGGNQLGHIAVQLDGARCVCGNRGCAETFVSAPGIARMAADEGLDPAMAAAEVFAAADVDERAARVVDRFVEALAAAIVNAVHAYQPGLVVLAGGLTGSADRYVDRVRRLAEERAWTLPRGRVRIELSALGEHVGVLGAAAVALSSPRRTGGLPPRQVANQLLRCFRAEADLLRVLGGWTPRVEENEERLAIAHDIGVRAEHADAILQRLHRLRTTPRMVHVPDDRWRRLVELIDDAPSTADLLAGVYGVVGEALVGCYERLLADCDPLADELTIRLVERTILPDHRTRNRWASDFLSRHDADVDEAWLASVVAALDDARGLVVRSDDVPEDRVDEGAAAGTGFWPLPRPAPELLPLGSEYRIAAEGETVSYCPAFEEFGTHDAEVLANHHGLMPEISSLAIVGSLLHEVHDRPWEFYRDFATQCADEVRHIGLLLRRLEQLGAGTDSHPFPTWTFYDAVAFLPVTERTLVFNAVVEGNVVETLHDRARALREAGSDASAYVCDWISADESLHLHNGMRWLDAADVDAVDMLLDRGQAILGLVMRQKGTSEKIFDSASEALGTGDFYAERANPVAPIVRTLGGFDDDQIARLVEAAKGRTIRA